MIKPPSCYAEWADLLEEFKAGESGEELLSAMQQGTIEWQSGVAERFAGRLTDAVNTRMNSASDRFQRDMKRAGGSDSLTVQAILSLRKEMALLVRAAGIGAIPEKDRAQYTRLVREQADKMQSSLEESAKKDRSGKLYSLVRNHRVNALD